MQSIILCGLGFMGSMHLQAYLAMPSVRLAGVVDKRKAHARKTLDQLGLTKTPVFPTLAKALASVENTGGVVCLHRGYKM